MFIREPKKHIRCPYCSEIGVVGCEECNYLGYGTNIAWEIWNLNREHKEERKQEKRNRRKLKSGS